MPPQRSRSRKSNKQKRKKKRKRYRKLICRMNGQRYSMSREVARSLLKRQPRRPRNGPFLRRRQRNRGPSKSFRLVRSPPLFRRKKLPLPQRRLSLKSPRRFRQQSKRRKRLRPKRRKSQQRRPNWNSNSTRTLSSYWIPNLSYLRMTRSLQKLRSRLLNTNPSRRLRRQRAADLRPINSSPTSPMKLTDLNWTSFRRAFRDQCQAPRLTLPQREIPLPLLR